MVNPLILKHVDLLLNEFICSGVCFIMLNTSEILKGHNKKFLWFKGGLSLKIKNVHIHLYFIATQYLWKYALVEDIVADIDNWTRSFILIIIYWSRQK